MEEHMANDHTSSIPGELPNPSARGMGSFRTGTGLLLVPGIFSLILLFSVDIITTEMIIALGGSELNRLMAGVVAYPVAHLALKGIVLVYVTGVCMWAEKKITQSGVAAMAIIVAFYVVVALHNMSVLHVMMMTGA
ncbi:hypothetical protein ASZ90_016845 [hydrocarbon metagenome]|uniref:DUF5658 domain-containing protein n=1 Tax=hydrocarbon metagenome TaxID=938273 RepID=A0A0W8EAQ7_9ZZZZ